MDPVTVHVVSHTHWDREWYLGAPRFRQRLVRLVDELLDDPPAEGASFLLDGQMSVIEDYLAVRPERRERLAELARGGAIEMGPWYVLADELIPGGESLVRNLLAGRRWLARLGVSAPPVLYCPDSFGHPASLPTLAAGFGLDVIICSRGLGGARWPAGDTFAWRAPGGDVALVYHLSTKGYDIGENLPPDEPAARARWEEIRPLVVGRARTRVALLPNGADHHARQHDLAAAVRALGAAATPHRVMASSLAAFARAWATAAHEAGAPPITGELRDSYGYVWTLQGTFATRAHQKRRAAHAERLLVRDVEPWLAMARRRSGHDERALLDAAWRSLLLCHPHDTLCGCSTDEVARAMDVRLDAAIAQGEGLRDDTLDALTGHDPDRARATRDAWVPATIVRNPVARARRGVAELRLSAFASDVKVGANASPGPVETAAPVVPALAGVGPVQVLAKRMTHERTEAPRHYPDDDLVLSCDALAWVEEMPAYGVRMHEHRRRASRANVPNPARTEGARGVTNGLLSVDIDAAGRVRVVDHRVGRTIADAITFESETDLGDSYTPSLRGPRLTVTFRGARVRHRGPLRASVEGRWTLGRGAEHVDVTVRCSVDADAPFARFDFTGDHQVDDHRLRVAIGTEIPNGAVWADAAFGPVERRPVVVSDADAAFERPPATQPLHRYVSTFAREGGATVLSDGLAECEVTERGAIAVTLVRAVGELSRNDLPERPGHAGWPTPTPESQSRGPFAARLALFLHGPRSADVIDAIERVADDVLLPITGATRRSTLAVAAPIAGPALTGIGLACSAITSTDDGAWMVLRSVNLTEGAVEGRWDLPFTPREARVARLDGTSVGPAAVDGAAVRFTAAPRAVTTLLVR